MSDKPNINELLELTTEIVSAHVSNNLVAIGELPSLIKEVYKTMSMVGGEQITNDRLRPAVPLNKSVFPDYIIWALPVGLIYWADSVYEADYRAEWD